MFHKGRSKGELLVEQKWYQWTVQVPPHLGISSPTLYEQQHFHHIPILLTALIV